MRVVAIDALPGGDGPSVFYSGNPLSMGIHVGTRPVALELEAQRIRIGRETGPQPERVGRILDPVESSW